jgi:hypothetical protein
VPRFFLACHRAHLGFLRRRERRVQRVDDGVARDRHREARHVGRRRLRMPRRVARDGEGRCDHLHDTVSRYDHAAKRLELLLTCPVCETEKVIHSLAYEPRFQPSVACVHALHPRERAAVDALDRAA